MRGSSYLLQQVETGVPEALSLSPRKGTVMVSRESGGGKERRIISNRRHSKGGNQNKRRSSMREQNFKNAAKSEYAGGWQCHKMNLRRHVLCHFSGESKHSYGHYTVRLPLLDPWYPLSQSTQSSAPGNALHPSKPHLYHTADTIRSHGELWKSRDFLKFR